jgi:hypothetical protein
MTNKPTYPLPNPSDPIGLAARPVFDPTNPGKYAGQDRSGQSSLPGVKPIETYSQVKYGRPAPVDTSTKRESNPASTHAAAAETTKDIPKTG